MKRFDDLWNYYFNMYEDILKEGNIFGSWSEHCRRDTLEEGLITSYPRQKVVDFLKSLGYDDVAHKTNDNDPIEIMGSNVDTEKFSEEINSKLNVYGYFVSKYSNYPNNMKKFILEPKHPMKIEIDMDNGDFYHVTFERNLEKIEQMGLTPKLSKTVFVHPGDRIYLLQTKRVDLFEGLKKQIADSQLKALLVRQPNLSYKYWNSMTPQNMVVLKVDLDDSYDLYSDPMFISMKNSYLAVFVKKNIPPSKIILTNY